MSTVDLSLDNYPTIKELAKSTAYVRACIGPAGSAKTSCMVKILTMLAIQQEPDKNGVRWTRWLIVRETYQQLISATLKTFQTFLEPIAEVRESAPPIIKIRLPLPDGTFVNSIFEFLSMDKPDSVSKLLGYEPTGAFLDEISELNETIIEGVISRVGRFPSGVRGSPTWTGVICTTNGPMKSHWLYKWQQKLEGKIDRSDWDTYEEVSGRPFFELFRQPPALIRPTKEGEKWLPNPMAENVENLKEGYGYYYKMLSQSDTRVRAYVEGDFSDLQTGEVVFPEFQPDVHIIKAEYCKVPNGAPIMMSFDFGRTPVCLKGVMTKTGQLVITKEFMGENMAVETLFDQQIQPYLAQHLPRSKVVSAWGDPAGATGGQGLELLPFEVLQEVSIPIEVTWGSGNQLEPRLSAVRKRFRTLDANGKPMLLISDECEYLIAALTNGYVYEASKVSGEVKDTPTKTHINWISDLCDALQYFCLGCDTRYAQGNRVDKRIKSHRRKSLL